MALANLLMKDQSSFHTHLAVIPEGRSDQGKSHKNHAQLTMMYSGLIFLPVQIIRITLALENGISNVHKLESSILQFGVGRVKDVKFLDGCVMLVLWELNGERALPLWMKERNLNQTQSPAGCLPSPIDFSIASLRHILCNTRHIYRVTHPNP